MTTWRSITRDGVRLGERRLAELSRATTGVREQVATQGRRAETDEPFGQRWRERAHALLADGSRERAVAVLAVAVLELGLLLVLAVSVTASSQPARVEVSEGPTVRRPDPHAVRRERSRRERPRRVVRPARKRVRPPLQLPGTLPVLVLNGNGISGAATRAAAVIGRLGYPVTTGDARRFDYRTSIVVYKPGFAREAARLAHELHIVTRELYDPSVWTLPASVELVVVLGRGTR